MDLPAALSTASAAIELLKQLRTVDKLASDTEAKLRMIDLQEKIADLKTALIDARDRIADLERENGQLKAVRSRQMRTVSYRGFNFGIDEGGKPIGRPFCPNCEQSNGRQMQLSKGPGRYDFCPACKATFGDAPYKLPEGYDVSGAS